MFKIFATLTGRMTGETGVALPNVRCYAAVDRVSLGLSVTNGTGEHGSIGGVYMAFRAGVPHRGMGTGIYREIKGIVFSKLAA